MSKLILEFSQRRELILSVVRQPLEISRPAQEPFVVPREVRLKSVLRKKLQQTNILRRDLRFYRRQLFLLSNQRMSWRFLNLSWSRRWRMEFVNPRVRMQTTMTCR
jgi:hypothetical protein